MRDSIETCRFCGSEDMARVPHPTAPSGLQYRCGSCGRCLGFVRLEMTAERAAAFVVPIGEYRGKTFAEVYEINPSRVRWFASDAGPGKAIQRAARAFLESQGVRLQ